MFVHINNYTYFKNLLPFERMVNYIEKTNKLEEELLGKLEGYLGNKNAAAYLLALLRGEYNSVPKLPREIHQLAKKGIVRIESVQFFSAELDE